MSVSRRDGERRGSRSSESGATPTAARDQLSNIQRMITQADQKIGKDAYDRYADLIKEMQAIEAQLKKLGS